MESQSLIPIPLMRKYFIMLISLAYEMKHFPSTRNVFLLRFFLKVHGCSVVRLTEGTREISVVTTSYIIYHHVL